MTTPTTIVELRSTLLQVPWRGDAPAAGILSAPKRDIYVLEIETQGGLVGMSYLMPLRGGLLVAGGVLFLLCLILVAHMPALWLAVAMLMLGGAGTAVFAALQTALPVTMAPEGARSRVLGLVATCIGMSPIGVLAIGVLADTWGPPAAITIMATAGLVLMAWTVWLLARRR